MERKTNLILSSLDQQLQGFKTASEISRPTKGWIQAVRKALGMSRRQLGERMSITSQSVGEIEQREEGGNITLNNLRQAGRALDLQLIYGFIPIDGSLAKTIEKRATELATEIVSRTHQTMVLEDQQLQQEQLRLQIQDLAQELIKTKPRHLWDH